MDELLDKEERLQLPAAVMDDSKEPIMTRSIT